MSEKYYNETKDNVTERIRELKNDLPYFCSEFFIGVENRTTPLTRLNYAYDLRIFFDFITKEIPELKKQNVHQFGLMDLNLVTATHIEQFLEYLSSYEFNGKKFHNDERAKSRKLSTLRAFFKYYFKKEKISSNVTEKVDAPKLHEKAIIKLEANEVTDLLEQAETGYALTPTQQAFHRHTNARDYALLSLILGTGIRVSECVGLDIDDIDFNTNTFKVVRKGGNQVILYLSDEIAEILKKYLNERLSMKDVPETERALFLSLQKKRICTRAVQNLVKKYSSIATPLKNISPHKLRKTYGTNLYHETRDIYVVAEVLGHKDINTTKKHYAAMGEDIRKNAANAVKLRN